MAKRDNCPFNEGSPSPCPPHYRQRDLPLRESRARYHTPSASPSSNSSNGRPYSERQRDRSRSPPRNLSERKGHFEQSRKYQHQNEKRHARVNRSSAESCLESESSGESHERNASLPPLCEHDSVVIKGAAKQKTFNDGTDRDYRVEFDDDCAYQLELLWEMELGEEDYPRKPLHVAEDLKLELEKDLFWEVLYGDPDDGRPREVGWIALLEDTMMVLV